MYQYQFKIAKVNGKRKYIIKSGFKTKNEELMAGTKVYDEYINGSNPKDSQMSYLDKGAEIRDVADILGPSKIETIENYYLYSSDESRKYASEIFEKSMQSSKIDEIIVKY